MAKVGPKKPMGKSWLALYDPEIMYVCNVILIVFYHRKSNKKNKQDYCHIEKNKPKSKVVSAHLWNTPLNLYQQAKMGFLS